MTDSTRLNGIHVEHAPATGTGAAGPGRPPVLLVHGAGHGAWCWQHWMATLPAQGWETYALSLRNHPPSDAVDDETYLHRLSVGDYAADVAVAARHIGRSAVVVGHSMGGIVAQQYAATRTAADPAPAGLALLTSVVPGQLGPIRDRPIPTDAPFAWRDIGKAFFHNLDAAALAPIEAQLVGESPSVINEYSLAPGVPIAPEAIGCPMLVVSAEHDGTTVPRDDRIATYYGADYHFARGIGHDVMLDGGWEQVLDEVLRWLTARYG